MELVTHERTLTIDSGRRREAAKVLERLAKKGKKTGNKLEWELGEPYKKEDTQYVEVRTWCDARAYEVRDVVRDVVDVHITGTLPKIEGWELCAKLHFEAGIEDPLVSWKTGKLPERVLNRTSKGGVACDHCKTNRARKHVLVLRKGRQVKVVGTTCVKDFTGWDGDLTALVRWNQVVGDLLFGEGDHLDEFWGKGGTHACQYYGLEDYCTAAALAIRKHGWVSRGSAREGREGRGPHAGRVATADAACGYIESGGRSVEKGDIDTAKAAIKMAKRITKAERVDGDLLQNLWAIAKAGTVSERQVGLAAWMVQWSIKKAAELAEEKRKTSGGKWCGTSSYVGRVGERVETLVRVTGIISIEGWYGTTRIVKMLTEDGNILTWFCTGCLQDLSTDVEVVIRGTVKKHEDYKGDAQTILARCKVVDVVKAA
jgi:hypothetical protein